ncbi:HAD family hydrolase [Roseibium litorale]|uniref:HAD family phosphatase n=1 Tax=Roseibium litorale TaxID=2803841 RepID=A0ABR9CNZ6_9HYPH|nr:HAD family phosphatase [Roseibium litorale]MBD8892334.1 HAD family phosphatase [Roseibium litorale]
MTAKATTVVFDIGNVLIEWDPNHLYQHLLPDPAERKHFLTEICSYDWNLEQDRGRSWDEAVDLLVAEYPEKRDLITAYRDRWHDMVPGEISGTVAILEELKAAQTPLYAITNFSSEKFTEAQTRFPFLKTSFRDIVVSADERLLKPDLRIYEVLLERNGLDAGTCVFIDDSPKNVDAARAAGMHAVHFQHPDHLRAELKKLGLPV